MRETLSATLHEVRLKRMARQTVVQARPALEASQTGVVAQRMKTALATVHIAKTAALVHRGHVAPSAEAVRAHAYVMAVHATHVVVIATTSTTKVIGLLSLKLVLNALAVRCVANEREYRADTLNQQSALIGIGVVKSGLHAIVAVGVAE